MSKILEQEAPESMDTTPIDIETSDLEPSSPPEKNETADEKSPEEATLQPVDENPQKASDFCQVLEEVDLESIHPMLVHVSVNFQRPRLFKSQHIVSFNISVVQ